MTKDKRMGVLALAFHVSQHCSGSPRIGVHHVKPSATQIHRGFMFHGLSLGLMLLVSLLITVSGELVPIRGQTPERVSYYKQIRPILQRVVRDAINRLNRTAVSSSHLTKLSKKAGWEVPLLSPATPKKA